MFSVGGSVGIQSYQAAVDDPRVLSSIELLARRGNTGVHIAVEYTDLSQEGALIAVHPDFIYFQPLGEKVFLSLGAGPTFTAPGTSTFATTWNAELELGVIAGRAEIFGRVRHYDYSLARFREGESGPNGPAIYAGVRFRLGR